MSKLKSYLKRFSFIERRKAEAKKLDNKKCETKGDKYGKDANTNRS